MSVADLAEEEDLQLTATVPPDLAGNRLDAACARLFDQFSRSRLQAWIDEGRLRVNGETVTRSRQPVGQGDVLELDAVPPQDSTVQPQDLPLQVVHAAARVAGRAFRRPVDPDRPVLEMRGIRKVFPGVVAPTVMLWGERDRSHRKTDPDSLLARSAPTTSPSTCSRPRRCLRTKSSKRRAGESRTLPANRHRQATSRPP